MNKKKYHLGTRASKLALIQAKMVIDFLNDFAPEVFKNNIEIIPITTQGDKILDRPLYDIGGKGLFIKDIQKNLLDEKIDIAVHSMKDVEGIQNPEIELLAMPFRGDVRDVIISKFDIKSLEDLPDSSKIGTCSPRRASQIKVFKEKTDIISIRGNVETRIKKLIDTDLDCIILSICGLQRLGLVDENLVFKYDNLYMYILDQNIFLPAIGQAAIAIEYKKNNQFLQDIFNALKLSKTNLMVQAERSLLKNFVADCKTALGAYTTLDKNDLLDLKATYIEKNNVYKADLKGHLSNYERLGKDIAIQLKKVAKIS
jgi:hydroxymethylbilane synthase